MRNTNGLLPGADEGKLERSGQRLATYSGAAGIQAEEGGAVRGGPEPGSRNVRAAWIWWDDFEPWKWRRRPRAAPPHRTETVALSSEFGCDGSL